MKTKAILIDDDPTLCELGVEMFDILDIECFTAQTMEDALTLWKENNQDIGLAIFDLNLEGCTGVEVFEAMRALDSDFHAVIASGAFIDSDAEKYKALGFDETIPKPYSLNHLKELIGKYLS